MPRPLFLATAVITLLFAAATTSCSGPGSVAPREAASPPSSGTGKAAPGSSPEILGFTASLVGGGMLDGADLAGAPVAMWFWAPW